jgi:hypothetical protein
MSKDLEVQYANLHSVKSFRADSSQFQRLFVVSLRRQYWILSPWKLVDIQGDSLTRGPKLLSIKNYVIEFDGAHLSQNSVQNAIWHALNELVCQFLRTRNTRCLTVYILTHVAFNSQLPRCGDVEHRQMQVAGWVQYMAGGSMLFSIVAGMRI